MLNIITICGRLTSDPELKKTPNNVIVATFSVAVDRDYSKDGQRETDFINCVAWRGTADHLCKYFHKGKMIIVSGSLQVRNYTDQNGYKRYVSEVIADKVFFAGDKQKDEQSNATQQPYQFDPNDVEPVTADELPF